MNARSQLRDWMRARRAAAIAVRPDAIVYAAATAGEQLAAPLASTSLPRQQAPIGTEVLAPRAAAAVEGTGRPRATAARRHRQPAQETS